jgi:hypothetical protein
LHFGQDLHHSHWMREVDQAKREALRDEG